MRRSHPPRPEAPVGPPRGAFVVLSRAGTDEPEVIELSPGARLVAGSAPDSSPRLEGAPERAFELSWDGYELLLRAEGELYVEGKPFAGEALLESGEEIAVGRHQLIVGVSPPAELGPRRALTHDEFSERLREELARASRLHRPTTLLMLRVAQGAGGRVNELASAMFRAGDLASSFAPNEPELLLPDTDAEAAERVASRLLERVGERAHAGVAEAPLAGDTAERLMWAARQALDDASDRDLDFVRAERSRDELEDEWITEDPAFRAIEERLEALARTGESVLFSGEENTSKAVAARRLMVKSGARPERATYVACAALGDEEARIARAFGTDENPGGQIAGGSSPFVVLELACELTPEAQRRLLLAMDAAGRFRRYLATVQCPLDRLAQRGAFDRELYERLAEVEVRLPPLRSRPGDLLPLARRFAEMGGATRPKLSPGAIARLRAYSFPGNVLELRNAMERAVRLARGGPILAEHLPADPLPGHGEAGRLREHVGEVERDTIIRALTDASHNQTHAARRLGISRRALIYKMEKYGLKPPPGHARGA